MVCFLLQPLQASGENGMSLGNDGCLCALIGP